MGRRKRDRLGSGRSQAQRGVFKGPQVFLTDAVRESDILAYAFLSDNHKTECSGKIDRSTTYVIPVAVLGNDCKSDNCPHHCIVKVALEHEKTENNKCQIHTLSLGPFYTITVLVKLMIVSASKPWIAEKDCRRNIFF